MSSFRQYFLFALLISFLPACENDIKKVDELLKNKTITRFYALRNAGENVRNSLRTAITEGREEIEMKLFLDMLSSGLRGGQRGGGLLN